MLTSLRTFLTWSFSLMLAHPVGAHGMNSFALLDFSDMSAMGMYGDTQANGVGPTQKAELLLTRAKNQLSAVYTQEKVVLGRDGSFSASFAFRMGNNFGPEDIDGSCGGSGLVFVVKNSLDAMGEGGDGLGYRGLTNSLAIEFDTFASNVDPVTGEREKNGNHIGLNVNGSLKSLRQVNYSKEMNSGEEFHVWIDYKGSEKRIEVRISDKPERPLFAASKSPGVNGAAATCFVVPSHRKRPQVMGGDGLMEKMREQTAGEDEAEPQQNETVGGLLADTAKETNGNYENGGDTETRNPEVGSQQRKSQVKGSGFDKLPVVRQGGATTDLICQMLELFLLNEGIRPVFYESGYNRYYEGAVFENENLSSHNPDFILLVTCVQNLQNVPHLKASQSEYTESLKADQNRFYQIWDKLEANHGVPVIQFNFSQPAESSLGNFTVSHPRSIHSYINDMNSFLTAEAADRSNLYVFDAAGFAARIGLQTWHDTAAWYSFRYMCRIDLIPEVCHRLSRLLLAVMGRSKKCLVLDLDNTVWGDW